MKQHSHSHILHTFLGTIQVVLAIAVVLFFSYSYVNAQMGASQDVPPPQLGTNGSEIDLLIP